MTLTHLPAPTADGIRDLILGALIQHADDGTLMDCDCGELIERLLPAWELLHNLETAQDTEDGEPEPFERISNVGWPSEAFGVYRGAFVKAAGRSWQSGSDTFGDNLPMGSGPSRWLPRWLLEGAGEIDGYYARRDAAMLRAMAEARL